MLKHEQDEKFDELCALSAAGQLSCDEQRELAGHVKECESCRSACDDFSLILREMPAEGTLGADKTVLGRMEKSGLRERFLERARAEGVRFSKGAEIPKSSGRWEFAVLNPSFKWAAACLIVGILFGTVGYRIVGMAKQISKPTSVSSSSLAREDSQHGRNEDQSLLPKFNELQSLNEGLQKTIGSLKTENAELMARLNALEKQFEVSQTEKQEFTRTVAHLNDMNAALSNQMEQNSQLLAQTKGELEKVRNDRETVGKELAAEKVEVSSLSQQVRLQTTSLDQDKDLLVAGRDVRDLMGARNLHIIDVHDADGKGKDRKSFGRVFYTEGKSLIFYAFDLDEKKLSNAKYTFEAWGERLGQPGSVKRLGILYVDDKAQKRWALKVDDPQQLAQIDSVFVTLEPQEGTDNTPRGKRILYAFLAGQPNHP